MTFMDNQSFEQMNIDKNIIGNFSHFIKEGDVFQIFVYDDQAIGMRYPKKVRLMVTGSDTGAKGNTVMGAKKMVTVETGVSVAVPLFIKKGDTVAIDPETGEYLERVSQ